MMDDKGGLGGSNKLLALLGMADDGSGGVQTKGEATSGGSVLDPWPGMHEERTETKCGPCGVNDQSIRSLESLFAVRRHGSFFVTVGRTAGGALFIKATGDKVLRAFTAGRGEKGADCGLMPADANLTRADTDSYTNGALVPTDRMDFRLTGMGVNLFPGFRVATVEGDAGSHVSDDFWSEYGDRLTSLLVRNSFLTLRHGVSNTDGLGFDLGRLDFHPSMSGLQGGGLTVGKPVANAFVPFDRPDFTGGPKDDDSLVLELAIARTVSVSANELVPVPALGGGEFYQIPISIELYGRAVNNNNVTSSRDVANVAQASVVTMLDVLAEDVDMSNPAQVAEFRAKLRKMRARLAAGG